MISKSIKTTSGSLKVTIPSDAKEISIDLLQRLTPGPGDSFSQLKQLSILSGIPVDSEADEEICLLDICNIDDLDFFNETLQTLAYKLKYFVTLQEIPKEVRLMLPERNAKRWFNPAKKTSVIPIPKNLRIEPAGAYLESKSVIVKEFERWEKAKELYPDANLEFNPSVEAQLRLISLYLYVPATGNKFNPQRAAEFDEVVKQLPITEALPIARFFFLKYQGLLSANKLPFQESVKRIMKLKQALKR